MLPRLAAAYLCEARSPYTSVSTVHHHRADAEAQIRSQSKASGSGLCEGDEVVSINGSPCADLTYPQVIKLMESVTDSLRMLVKRQCPTHLGHGRGFRSVR
ncbi:synaptopodin-2-like [Pteropus vampyrus]|uniref:Synaptopodin-2-like n=1 Tax=Pteropus vampyrus TaxID=132908 RepID=A0A6P6CYV7_PTEVA|nr:synaptopodin-2-like [Pteropus vampyrus]